MIGPSPPRARNVSPSPSPPPEPKTKHAQFRVKLSKILAEAVTAEIAARDEISTILNLEDGEIAVGSIDTHRDAIEELCSFRNSASSIGKISQLRIFEHEPELVRYTGELTDWVQFLRSQLLPIDKYNQKLLSENPVIRAKIFPSSDAQTATLDSDGGDVNNNGLAGKLESRSNTMKNHTNGLEPHVSTLERIEDKVEELQKRLKNLELFVHGFLRRKRIVNVLRAAKPLPTRKYNETLADEIEKTRENVNRITEMNSKTYASFKKSHEETTEKLAELDDIVQTIPETFEVPNPLPVKINRGDIFLAVQNIVFEEFSAMKVHAELAFNLELQARREDLLMHFVTKTDPVSQFWEEVMESGSLNPH